MSRRVVIKGGVHCRLPNFAEEVVSEMQSQGLRYDVNEGVFVYDGLDDYYKKEIIEKAESRYGLKLQAHQIEKIKENVKKGKFKVEKKATETGKIKLILKMRVYD